MSNKEKVILHKKTQTTLVYKASDEYAKEILQERYKPEYELYIHVGREYGFVTAYINQDPNKMVKLRDCDLEYILGECEDIR